MCGPYDGDYANPLKRKEVTRHRRLNNDMNEVTYGQFVKKIAYVIGRTMGRDWYANELEVVACYTSMQPDGGVSGEGEYSGIDIRNIAAYRVLEKLAP